MLEITYTYPARVIAARASTDAIAPPISVTFSRSVAAAASSPAATAFA